MREYKRKKHYYNDAGPCSLELRVTIASVIMSIMALASSIAILCFSLNDGKAVNDYPWLVTMYATCILPSIIVSYDGIRKKNKESKYTKAESNICEISLCGILVSIVIFILSG
jgi:hypothetical protein